MPVSGRMFYGSLGINGDNISQDPRAHPDVVRVEINGTAIPFTIPLSGRLATHSVNSSVLMVLQYQTSLTQFQSITSKY